MFTQASGEPRSLVVGSQLDKLGKSQEGDEEEEKEENLQIRVLAFWLYQGSILFIFTNVRNWRIRGPQWCFSQLKSAVNRDSVEDLLGI